MSEKDTIYGDSNLGKRLGKLRKSEALYLHYGDQKTRIVDRIVIGRAKECDIVLADTMASRRHAAVQKIKDAYFITDLASTNGVLLNGKPVQPNTYVRLRPRDVVTIGRTDLQLLVG